MKSHFIKRRGNLLPTLMVIAILSAAMCTDMMFTAAASAEESISVTCYNLQKSEWPVGRVVVYDTSQAAGTCNSVYYVCKGQCIGCFSDSDYLDSVCADTRGNLFLK